MKPDRKIGSLLLCTTMNMTKMKKSGEQRRFQLPETECNNQWHAAERLSCWFTLEGWRKPASLRWLRPVCAVCCSEPFGAAEAAGILLWHSLCGHVVDCGSGCIMSVALSLLTLDICDIVMFSHPQEHVQWCSCSWCSALHFGVQCIAQGQYDTVSGGVVTFWLRGSRSAPWAVPPLFIM